MLCIYHEREDANRADWATAFPATPTQLQVSLSLRGNPLDNEHWKGPWTRS
jgi:hypothetical protein